VILAFVGTIIVGFVLFLVIDHFRPVPSPRRFGKGVGCLSVSFAVAAALDEMKRRAANRRRARCGANGPSAPPEGFPEVIRARVGCPQPAAATPRAPDAEEVRGLTSLTDTGDHPIVFRPYRKPMLIVALLLAGFAAVYTSVAGILEPVPLLKTVRIPGPLVVDVALFGAALYLGLFVRSCLPGRRITVDTSGIVLPRRRRVMWDQITEVKLCNPAYIEFLGTVRIRLDDGRRIHIPSGQIGCEPRKLYEAIQACFEEHKRHAGRHRHESELRDAHLHPLTGVHSR